MFRIFLKFIYVSVIFFQGAGAFAQTKGEEFEWGNWQIWGDQGDGTYKNPIIPSDYSDIDAIRVGDEYYAVSSTFQYSPGFVILHSKDMVNWTILGHAVEDITQISPAMNWSEMDRYGRGIWAGAIRYHDNKFWVYFGTPDEGYFMTTSEDPAGPWEPLHQLLDAEGWDDGCPFWDDDGKAYFIGTNFANDYKIHLFEMSPDGKTLNMETDKVIYSSKGSEANKLYKWNGMYYHFFSEVAKGGRRVMMERSENIWGPYEGPKQLGHVQRKYHEPNQGAIIQTQKGDWYFLTHHGSGGDWSGRIMSLLPVHWVDGWPILEEVGSDTIGNMVWTGEKPIKGEKIVFPQTSDDFNASKLPPQWEWNYYPRIEMWSLSERKGWLRLHAFKPLRRGDLRKAGNTLTQRSFRSPHNKVVVKLDISGMADGQKAGFSHFGNHNYSTIGVVANMKAKNIEFYVKGEGNVTLGPEISGDHVWLKSTWGLDGISQYYYSTDGKNYLPFGEPYQMSWSSYRGDRLAIYSYNDKADAGYIDVDFFHYRLSTSKNQKN